MKMCFLEELWIRGQQSRRKRDMNEPINEMVLMKLWKM